MLLERQVHPPAVAIERLGALQAQWSAAPYIALWSRLCEFKISDLAEALSDRSVVKATLMRGTLHLVSARDYGYMAVAAPESRNRSWETVERSVLRYWGDQSEATRLIVANWRGLGDREVLHAKLLRYARTPRSRPELSEFMAKETGLPVELARHFLWSFVATHGGLVHAPESAAWAATQARRVVAASTWLSTKVRPDLVGSVAYTVRRYLAAFGPATIEDVSSWTSIRTTLIRPALSTLAEIVHFTDDRGRILYDLAESPRPPEETPAPPRFLAKWDSPLLAYTPAERIRILPERYRPNVIGKNGDVVQTVLVDGVVAARWDAREIAGVATLRIAPLNRIATADRSLIAEEGERLVRFVHPESRSHAVRFTRADGVPNWNLGLRP